MESRDQKIIDITVNSQDAFKNILHFREENERLRESTKQAKDIIKENEEAIKKSGQASEAQTRAIRDSKAQIEKDTASRKLNNKAILDNQKVLMAQVKENQATEGSIREMRLEVSKLTVEWENMSGEMRKGELGEALREELASLNAEINSASLSVNYFKDNIGNYSSALGGALNNNSLITKSLKAMGIQVDSTAVAVGKNLVKGLKDVGIATKAQTVLQGLYTAAVGTTTGALKVLRIALISTGVGAIVVLIGTLIALLSKASKATSEYKSAVDGATFATKEARDAHEAHIKSLRDLNREYRILTGQISAYESELEKLAEARQERLNEIERWREGELEGLKKGSKKYREAFNRTLDEMYTRSQQVEEWYAAMLNNLQTGKRISDKEEQERERERVNRIIENHEKIIQAEREAWIEKNKYRGGGLVEGDVFDIDDEKDSQELYERLRQQQEERQQVEYEARMNWRYMQIKDEFSLIKELIDDEYKERVAAADRIGADTTDIMEMWHNEQKQLAHMAMMSQLSGVATIAGSIGSIIGDLVGKTHAGAVFAKSLGMAQILTAQGVAVAEGIKSAIGVPFPANIPALATVMGAVASGVSQAKSLLGRAEIPKPPAILNARTGNVTIPSISTVAQSPVIRELGVIENRSRIDDMKIKQEPPIVLVKDIMNVTEKVRVKENNAGY